MPPVTMPNTPNACGVTRSRPDIQQFVWLQAGISICLFARLSQQGVAASVKVVIQKVLAAIQLAAAQLAHTDIAQSAQQSTTAKAQSCVLPGQRSTMLKGWTQCITHLLRLALLGPFTAKHGLIQKPLRTAPGRSRGRLTALSGQLTAQHTGAGLPVTCIRQQLQLQARLCKASVCTIIVTCWMAVKGCSTMLRCSTAIMQCTPEHRCSRGAVQRPSGSTT